MSQAPTAAIRPTLIIHAHPAQSRSQVTRALLETLSSLPHTSVRSLYHLYPDFDIDIEAEQHALRAVQNVIWLAPVHWYGVPSLLKHWIDNVLTYGWAYGRGGAALHGKNLWWVASAGADAREYSASGSHHRPFAEYIAPIQGIAEYCGMHWLPPFITHGMSQADAAQWQSTRAGLLAQAHRLLAERIGEAQ
ncbi:NAD(P)H-dependent oxidoreductase [Massilia sp. W12]|uniref:glutathione-regulated potassium-efflux system oxidoreductase KefF n=1 Tax=Massilia sp. W12 TaxID=3126507 RepID=UPI0030CFB6C6